LEKDKWNEVIALANIRGLKLKRDGLSLLFGQSYFRITFYETHPQCKGCKHIDMLIMDYEIYPAIKERHCKSCDNYNEW
jgi:hypothetical protein